MAFNAYLLSSTSAPRTMVQEELTALAAMLLLTQLAIAGATLLSGKGKSVS
jgi:hypothetical protein